MRAAALRPGKGFSTKERGRKEKKERQKVLKGRPSAVSALEEGRSVVCGKKHLGGGERTAEAIEGTTGESLEIRMKKEESNPFPHMKKVVAALYRNSTPTFPTLKSAVFLGGGERRKGTRREANVKKEESARGMDRKGVIR